MANKIIIISGPTASGKSSLALAFAKYQDICIINADSLQIYEGLPILSSQPNAEEMKQVDHTLYSALKASENSSVGLWLNLAKTAIENCWKQGKLPVIVGGSGMYISKLVDGISEIPEVDETLKEGARELFEQIGINDFKRGLVDAKLEAEGLTAAKGFASKWNWKETLTRVYFSGADWGIRRHKVTGIQTARAIKGVIVMTRPDGLCSYHDAVFAQEYDGTKYRTVYFDGILGAPFKLNCEHAK